MPTDSLRIACLAVLTGVGSVSADEPLPQGHVRLTGVEVKAIERTTENGRTNDHESDTLTHWIRFDVHPTYEVVKGTEAKPFRIVNATVRGKSRMTLDKPITFRGKPVPAGTNLLDYRKFNGSTFNVHLPELFPYAIHSARVTRDFAIPADTYTVTFAWTTSEGKVLSDRVKVRIDVDLPAGR